MSFDHKKIESKWQEIWEREKAFRADDASQKPKFYCLDMFPYPSGAGLHVGHPEGYTATDIISRKRRMQGYEVLHPMGWDAFGLPAENYAIKTGTHPDISTSQNVVNFTGQIKRLGFSYDWDREINTSKPEYYRWTQWWFLFLYQQGLAYKKEAPVNWCPKDQTVLANEQVVNGACERCGTPVEQKNMSQWFFKITDFIEDQRNQRKQGRAVLLHGWEGTPESNFLPWLRRKLESAGWQVSAPQLPNTMQPQPEEWLAAIDELQLDENTVVIGHSLGGTAITRWLESRRKKIGKVVLVAAPTLDPGPHPETVAFKALPLSSAIRDLAEFEILQSSDDPFVSMAEAETLGQLLGAPVWTFSDRGHFKQVESAEILLAATTRVTRGLISGLDKIDWPESTKVAQRNWIGRSEGAEIDFAIEGSNEKITVFTTRADTLAGVTYVVLAPEHSLVDTLTTQENKAAVASYIEQTKLKSDLDRQSEKEKTGVPTGAFATNPLTGERVPVWIADYVLANYGTGAVMGVPAHDERDFAFAKKFNLKIKAVVLPTGNSYDPLDTRTPTQQEIEAIETETAFIEAGRLINSGEFTGLRSEQAKIAIPKHLEENNSGRLKTTYKLRDWLVSRQRYWGAPIPIIYDEADGEHAVEDSALPVELPTDVDFVPHGESPLAASKSFHANLPAGWRRESDTMDTFVCSSWYFFRFADPQNAETFANPELMKKWLPVDLYVGGAEHTVLHLLYSRFFTKVLHRAGLIDFDEPFLKLRHQGMILAEDGRKMSKSLGNVVNPDEVVAEFGADTLRCYEMFMGPFADAVPWSTAGVAGVRRWLEKIWRIWFLSTDNGKSDWKSKSPKPNQETDLLKSSRAVNKAIKKVSEDIENFKFNTAVATMMELVNTFNLEGVSKKDFAEFLKILAPFAPHLAAELWEQIGNADSVHVATWPSWDEALTRDESVTFAVSVQGKPRGTIELPAEIAEAEAVAAARAEPGVAKWLDGKEIVKTIFVPGKMINFVVR